jgi:hypothetical protein
VLRQATVVLWSATRELGRTTTDNEGRFRFEASVAQSATGLVVRRLGYLPRTLQVRPGDESLRLTLTSVTQSLPAAVVTATRRQCPFREDPKARARWNATRSTYAVAPVGIGHLAAMHWRRGDMAAVDVAEVDETRIGPGYSGVTGRARLDYDASVAADGYASRRAAPRPGTSLLDPAYFAWWYPPLHREMIEEFVGDRFGKRHLFRTLPGADSTPRLLFCPRDAKQPALEGSMELAPDGSVARIQWQFVTPKPREGAGGEVMLVPPGSGSIRRLVPSRSVYWRRLSDRTDRYYQDAAIYRGWYWGATEAIPSEPTTP